MARSSALLRQVLLLFQSLLRWLCGGGRQHKDLGHTEAHERLLSSAPQIPASSALHNTSVFSVVSDSPEFINTDSQNQLMLVMRHGHRQDEEDHSWHITAERPWDPPLSNKGRVEAREAGARLRDLGVEYVISSPFLRCLQTSAELLTELGLPQGCWLVHWGLAEICDPRLLFAGRIELLAQVGAQPIDHWMWQGRLTQQALTDFYGSERHVSGVNICPEVWNDKVPGFPEKLEGALIRYGHTLQSLMKTFEGRRVLVVTHGEAVRAAVVMLHPQHLVYEVKHTAFVPISRSKEASGHWGVPVLECESGETGVSWYEGN